MTSIKIGSQEWATEDLKVTKFRNGEDIPLVNDGKEWGGLTTAAYCISPDGNYLYNWHAVNDSRGLAPEGFHVPSDEELTQLTEFLGGENVAGNEMKSTDWDGTNSSGFSALPVGFRNYNDGLFFNLGYDGYWWSSSPSGSLAWYRGLASGYSSVTRGSDNVRFGFSVRCIKTQVK